METQKKFHREHLQEVSRCKHLCRGLRSGGSQAGPPDEIMTFLGTGLKCAGTRFTAPRALPGTREQSIQRNAGKLTSWRPCSRRASPNARTNGHSQAPAAHSDLATFLLSPALLDFSPARHSLPACFHVVRF